MLKVEKLYSSPRHVSIIITSEPTTSHIGMNPVLGIYVAVQDLKLISCGPAAVLSGRGTASLMLTLILLQTSSSVPYLQYLHVLPSFLASFISGQPTNQSENSRPIHPIYQIKDIVWLA